MILPIGDAPNPTGWRPWVTWLLIAANVLIYLLFTLPLSLTRPDPGDPLFRAYLEQLHTRLPDVPLDVLVRSISAWDLTVFVHGYKPGAPSAADLFSAMFMHAGFAHLAGNMLFLWIYGDNVEHRLGRLGFLAAYLGSGAIATLAFALLVGSSMAPLVGASGAISGVLGLYFVLFPRNVVRLLIALFPFWFDVVLVPAPIVLGLYVLVDNLLPLVVGASSGVAYGAHLGGFLAGVAVAVVGQRLGWRVPGLGPAEPAGDTPVERAAALERAGRVRDAAGVLQRALWQTPPEDRAAIHLALGSLLGRHGARSEAFQHLVAARRDPALRARADAALASLGIDPRLLGRLRG